MVLLLLPLYWMLITSLKGEVEIYSYSRQTLLIVKAPTLANYRWLFTKIPYACFYLNTITVAGVTAAFSLVVSVIAGYAIAHLRFSGAAVIGILIFVTCMIPRALVFIPLAVVTQRLAVHGKLSSLFLAYPRLRDPVLHLAAQRLLQDHPARAGGVRHG
jgi:ABC-type glycerol-3-phosphate transport system permease component